MAELAFIHPLLVRNPLPADRLRSGRARAASACALAGECFAGLLAQALPEWPGMAVHDAAARRHALAWRDALGPALDACLDGVAAFARRHNDSLAPLLLAAADAEVDPAARGKLAGGLAALRSGAGAEHEIARQAAAAADTLRSACARDFVSFVVEADTLRRALPAGQALRAAFELAVDARQRAMGDAMAMVTGVIDAFGALESAWRELGEGFGQLAGQCTGAAINSALMVARLNAARAQWCTMVEIPRLPPALRETAGPAPTAAAAAASFGEQGAAAVVAELDRWAGRIGALPAPQGPGVPAALRHIAALRQLAHGWPLGARPAQMTALRAFGAFGASLRADDSAELHASLGHMADGHPEARVRAARQAAALSARLSSLASLMEAACADLGRYLAQVGLVARQIEADAALVNGRLRVAQQQAGTIQAAGAALRRRLDGAHARQRWLWRLGPLSALMTLEIDELEERLKANRAELHALRSAQALTLDDAACLQGLLPPLAGLLGSAERLRGGMLAALVGVQGLSCRLAELRQAIGHAPDAGLAAREHLQAALAAWETLVPAAP